MKNTDLIFYIQNAKDIGMNTTNDYMAGPHGLNIIQYCSELQSVVLFHAVQAFNAKREHDEFLATNISYMYLPPIFINAAAFAGFKSGLDLDSCAGYFFALYGIIDAKARKKLSFFKE